MSSYIPLGVFFGLVIAAASTGAIFQPGSWYKSLAKPTWTPPDWLFPVAWTVLYTMIAIAGWLVWRVEGIGPATLVWGAGLALNMAWSWIMFGEKKIGLAFGDLVLLWLSIVAFMALAWPLDSAATWLFAPYFVWVSFAGVLNLAVWRMNPGM